MRHLAEPTATVHRAPDRTLVQRIITGDEGAFRELLARYRSTVYATAYAIVSDPEIVEAVVTDTFRQARCHALEFLATRGTVSGWLTHLTRLGLAEQLRVRISRPHAIASSTT